MDFSKKMTFDLGININSFCEMTSEQVISYLRCLKVKNFYSNNRDRQPNNEQLVSLTNIFKTEGRVLSPSPEKYNNGNYKKRVYLIRTSNSIVDIDIDEIRGIKGPEMPAL